MKTNKGKDRRSIAEKAGLTQGSIAVDSKSCVTCLQSFPLRQFHWKDVLRQDKTCKKCRRLQRAKRESESEHRSASPNVVEGSAQALIGPSAPQKAKHPLLDADAIKQLAEAFLILETWQAEADTQGDVSNSKFVPTLAEE